MYPPCKLCCLPLDTQDSTIRPKMTQRFLRALFSSFLPPPHRPLPSRNPALEVPGTSTLLRCQNQTTAPAARRSRAECTKITRFSAVAAAIFTAPLQNRAIFKAPRCAISSAKKIASERRFSLRLKGTNLIPTAEFPAIPESAAKIASERRCAILVHSVREGHHTRSMREFP